MDRKGYMDELEQKVFLKAFTSGLFGERHEEITPVRGGKLIKTAFGKFVGNSFKSAIPVTLNYYGLYKHSTVIKKQIQEQDSKTKHINSIVLHYSSIKTEWIEQVAPELLDNFMKFKKYLVKLRWGT